MSRWVILSMLLLIPVHVPAAAPLLRAITPGGATQGAAVRGKKAMLGKSYNPPTMPLSHRDNAWKNWGLAEKPADFDRLFRERYGLHPAPVPQRRLADGHAHRRDAVRRRQGADDRLPALPRRVDLRPVATSAWATPPSTCRRFYEEIVGGRLPHQAAVHLLQRPRHQSRRAAMAVFLLGYREPDLSRACSAATSTCKTTCARTCRPGGCSRRRRPCTTPAACDAHSVAVADAVHDEPAQLPRRLPSGRGRLQGHPRIPLLS